MVLSDGRNHLEYEGDTKYVTETIMAADAFAKPKMQNMIFNKPLASSEMSMQIAKSIID
ncbi:hypothetical protein D3C77_603180 [compost metagenome]